MKKEQLAIKLTKKNGKKILNIIQEFGEPITDYTEGLLDSERHYDRFNTHIEFWGGEWIGSVNDEDKILIKPKELKQILARENLKKGDVIVIKTPFAKRTGLFERVLSDGKIGIKASEHGGYYGDFVRYATDEEKALLEPVKKEHPTLEEQVIQWASDKQILDKATPFKQAQKALEECGELLHAIGTNDEDEIKDAIGDVLVTLIIQAEMQGTTLTECLQGAYDVIKNRSGKIVNGTFVKD